MNASEKDLGSILFRNWWVVLLRGLLAITFGVLTWVQPGISLVMLVSLFSVYVMVDGLFGVFAAITGRSKHEDFWLLLLWGLVGIGAGILTLMVPDLTALALLFYIAAWAIATGVLQILGAIRLRRLIQGEWWFILCGLLSVIFGGLLLAQPAAGALAVLWLIGAYAIIFGLLLVILAFKVHAFAKHTQPEAFDRLCEHL